MVELGGVRVEQAMARREAGSVHIVGRSAGFVEEWDREVERLCEGFGEASGRERWGEAVFAQPFAEKWVGVVQVVDGSGMTGVGEGVVGFRFLVVGREAYVRFVESPFRMAERYPAEWQRRGELPTLEWEPMAVWRTVGEIAVILQRGDGPVLLGSAQALVDGARVCFERAAADNGLVRDLWELLPGSTRAHVWPASYVLGDTLEFHAAVVRVGKGRDRERYLNEEQAGDYPEGRYELALQTAVESGDQAELDRLFSRRSRSQTLRLAIVLTAAVAILALVMQVVSWSAGPVRRGKRVDGARVGSVREKPVGGMKKDRERRR